MSELRWSGYSAFVVDERERFQVSYDNVYEGFTLTHDLGRGSSHSVGVVGRFATLDELEAAAVRHATRIALPGQDCINGAD